MRKHRVIAINLPQFHPFKENDEWWGKGFTEWTNVTKAKPRFKEHYQPHLPTETGFYDLRLPEARQMQADMAREAGIYGFCYYHYWFNGHQLMERPVNEILSSGEPDFPFMLCWANENWARNWDGSNNHVLMKQEYSEEDDIAHMRWLCKNVFSDKRYIRVDDKPVFAVYKVSLFPNFPQTVKKWREIALEEFGMDLYLMYADFPDNYYGQDPSKVGVDASFDFQPIVAERTFTHKYSKIVDFSWKIPWLWKQSWYRSFFDNLPHIFSYKEYVESMKQVPPAPFKKYPCVSPGFDNASRRANRCFSCFPDATPSLFGSWLSSVISNFKPFSSDENFVFINAWNEWAEGNHLEPDVKWGRAYLEETKQAILRDY